MDPLIFVLGGLTLVLLTVGGVRAWVNDSERSRQFKAWKTFAEGSDLMTNVYVKGFYVSGEFKGRNTQIAILLDTTRVALDLAWPETFADEAPIANAAFLRQMIDHLRRHIPAALGNIQISYFKQKLWASNYGPMTMDKHWKRRCWPCLGLPSILKRY